MSEEEKVYLDEGGIRVTNARFVVPDQTYTMSGVTSVRKAVNQPMKGPAILGVVGLLMFFPGEIGAFVVGALCIAGAVYWYLKGTIHIVVLSSASGEAEALSNKDADKIARIIDALNDSIVGRG